MTKIHHPITTKNQLTEFLEMGHASLEIVSCCLETWFFFGDTEKIEVVSSLNKAGCNTFCPLSLSYKYAGFKPSPVWKTLERWDQLGLTTLKLSWKQVLIKWLLRYSHVEWSTINIPQHLSIFFSILKVNLVRAAFLVVFLCKHINSQMHYIILH